MKHGIGSFKRLQVADKVTQGNLCCTAAGSPAPKNLHQMLYFFYFPPPLFLMSRRANGRCSEQGRSVLLPPKKFIPDHKPDRRLNVRYPVRGSLMIDVERERYKARPVNLSFAGIMFEGNRLPPADAQGVLQLIIDGFDEIIVAGVRFIWVREDCAAAMFIYPPASLVRCVEWLANRRAKNESSHADAGVSVNPACE